MGTVTSLFWIINWQSLLFVEHSLPPSAGELHRRIYRSEGNISSGKLNF
jgi:hypothetical protein